MKDQKLSHVDSDGNAKMVDVSEKSVTKRTATAQSVVTFPKAVFDQLSKDNFLGKKGSIIQTAIIAGTMAAKKTSDLIPLCHPLALSKIQLDIAPGDHQLNITATVKCEGKTGVEMEALTAASVAALTIYDMCKALTHDINITETKLMAKEGGKNAFNR
ncbi:cyclic pyranopterin monophosphate synthase MoaC [Echinicola vietnamensis]|uniref:cyclic pyranopterin monophosphate synthase n=1 Tax=Echinicola vietnamensis (strain DSM 17526 / LMG 23754 / KMM 6221) TaxID=926556 RepID=L0FYN2_ECHVK|nr:cyclic pyranopterin monophosphate synthase MoaC [Echinicola vietnamensis]AGA78148.1 molybdenum cofactor biosynthesis protein MoaC [Echinicola vietnamensis DSM 17526]